jgi:trans-aconitate methyltransferase
MDHPANDTTRKPATAARIYDYYLGGIHNFPADERAARTLVAQFPFIAAVVRANRAFLGRAVRYLVDAGVRQFLDIGSGIPTEGNVHEIAQQVAPDARVVYVDVDPMAVAESQELLAGNDLATAIRADLRRPRDIFDHPEVRRLLDLRQPVGLLLVSVLHFVPDDTEAYTAVAQLVAELAPGGYLVVSHAASELFDPAYAKAADRTDVYRQQTPTPGTSRTSSEVERFFTGLDLVEPGVVRLCEWRPAADASAEPVDDPHGGQGSWAGIGRKV